MRTSHAGIPMTTDSLEENHKHLSRVLCLHLTLFLLVPVNTALRSTQPPSLLSSLSVWERGEGFVCLPNFAVYGSAWLCEGLTQVEGEVRALALPGDPIDLSRRAAPATTAIPWRSKSRDQIASHPAELRDLTVLGSPRSLGRGRTSAN